MQELSINQIKYVSAGFSPELAGCFMGVATGAFIGAAIGLPAGLIGTLVSYNVNQSYFYYCMAASIGIVPCSIITGAITGGVTGYFSGYTANQIYQYFQEEEHVS
jgi:hypothetical protein